MSRVQGFGFDEKTHGFTEVVVDGVRYDAQAVAGVVKKHLPVMVVDLKPFRAQFNISRLEDAIKKISKGEKSMDKQQTEHAIEVMRAWCDGKKVEMRRRGRTDDGWMWTGFYGPNWDWKNSEYRVATTKPSVNWDHVDQMYKWLARDKDGRVFVYSTKPWCLGGDGRWGRVHGLVCKFTPAECLASLEPGDCDWKDSLVERPS